MQKVQQSLLVVNVTVLMAFVVGVAFIVRMEEPAATTLRPIVRGERVEGTGAPAEADASVAVVEETTTRVCETSGKCSDRSFVAPILFAFLAGGIMNLPEVTALPCI